MFFLSKTSRRSEGGFTLIELLIVVAIIAILAAIAVPNFLEAQTRAKVSRVKADMRSLATAVESYVVDNNKYPASFRISPTDRFGSVTPTRKLIYSQITTPIAYFTAIPDDPFNISETDPNMRTIVYWAKDQFGTGTNAADLYSYGEPAKPALVTSITEIPELYDPVGNRFRNINTWLLFSVGPDKVAGINKPSYPSPIRVYDPTNGTVSDGDVLRFRG